MGEEQRIRELKNRLKNFKRVLKSGKLKPNEALKKATKNMNILPTRKYGVPPEEVEKRSLESEEYKLYYDFKRLKKVSKDAERYSRYNAKRHKKSKKKLRSPLNLGEIVYVLSARIKKKDAPSIFYKSSTDKKSFFNKNKKFVVKHRFENHRGTEFIECKNWRQTST